jgi:hypothetical protein
LTPDDSQLARGLWGDPQCPPWPLYFAQTVVALPLTPPNVQSSLTIVMPNAPLQNRQPVSKKYRIPDGATPRVNFFHPRDEKPTIIYREAPSKAPEVQTLIERNRALESRLTELSKEHNAVKAVVEDGWNDLVGAPGPARRNTTA